MDVLGVYFFFLFLLMIVCFLCLIFFSLDFGVFVVVLFCFIFTYISSIEIKCLSALDSWSLLCNWNSCSQIRKPGKEGEMSAGRHYAPDLFIAGGK